MTAKLMTRRDFLERATGAVALVAVTPPRLRNGAALARQPSAAKRMFVSLNGALTAGKNVGWPEFARLAARVGYGGVDWSLGQARAEGLDRTKALFAELQIKPTITNLPMARPLPFAGEDAEFRAGLVKLADDAGFCAAIGCHKMMLVLPPTGPLPKDEYRKVVRDRIGAVAGIIQAGPPPTSSLPTTPASSTSTSRTRGRCRLTMCATTCA
jgi:hypothetical protein